MLEYVKNKYIQRVSRAKIAGKGKKMKQKKTNIKIKHRKYNLYNRKKSKGKQILAIVITIVAAAALCVVGYGLGKPIVEYFQNKQNTSSDSSSAWTPPTLDADTSGGAETITAPESSETTQPDNEDKEESGFMLPVNAALNSESLKSAVAAAKNSGVSTVVVTLKNEDGNFLYKSGIEGIKDSEAVTGALTAGQIFGIINGAGLTPVAKISTLKDHVSYKYIEDMNFTTTDGWAWLDNFADQGGKTWLSPMLPATVKFIANITSELSAAGFKTILLADTMFPPFRPSYDYALVGDFSDSEQRLKALWKVIDSASAAAEKNGASIKLEMNGESLLGERTATDAEAAGDKEKLSSVPIIADYTADPSDSNAYINVKSFIGRMNSTYKEQEYTVLIKGGGFSASVLDTIKQAFAEAGIIVYME